MLIASSLIVFSGALYLSLLQSRLNWATSIFVKYKPDGEQQPRRAPATRRKWPNMKYLGSCTLHLGPHLFQDTSFYEAIRSEPWSRIIEAHQGVSVKKDDPEESTNEQPNVIDAASNDQQNNNSSSNSSSSSSSNSSNNDKIEGNINDNHQQEPLQLQWIDVVFELKEVPSERYVFPKEALISVCNNPVEVSFH